MINERKIRSEKGKDDTVYGAVTQKLLFVKMNKHSNEYVTSEKANLTSCTIQIIQINLLAFSVHGNDNT